MRKLTSLTFLILILSCLTTEATYLVDKSVEYEDPAGYIYLRAAKAVYTNPNADYNDANYYDWVRSYATSYVHIETINENTDFMAIARIGGTADRNTMSIPPTPTYNKIFYSPDYSAYSGYNQHRVGWVRNFFRNAKRDLGLSAGGTKITWVTSPYENPFNPYAEAYGDGGPSEVIGGFRNTD